MAQIASLSSVRVSWNKTGFTDAKEFKIYYRQTCRLNPTEMVTSVPFSQNSVFIDNLIEDTLYIFEVAASVIEDGMELIGHRGTSKPVELSYNISSATTSKLVETVYSCTSSTKFNRTFSETGNLTANKS